MRKCCYLILFISTTLLSCSNEKKQRLGDQPDFAGHFAYNIIVDADQPVDAQTFYTFNPSRVDMWLADSMFRLIETGGVSKGNILLDLKKGTAYQLDTATSIAHRGVFSDFEMASEPLREMMPDHFRPVLEATGKDSVIQLWNCQEFLVKRSGFTRPGANTRIWVTTDVEIPPSRYDIETQVNRVTTPIPLYIGIPEGTVVRLSYEAEGIRVRYDLVDLETEGFDQTKLVLPSSYSIE